MYSRVCRFGGPPWAVAVVVMLVGGLVGACGQPSAEQWAARVCDVLTPWRTEIASLTTEGQREISAAREPAAVRDRLVALLGGAERASDAARTTVVKLGAPDVAEGQAAAARVAGALEVARDAYRRARVELERTPTRPATAFYDAVVSIMTRLTTEYAHSSTALSGISSTELAAAIERAPECQKVDKQ